MSEHLNSDKNHVIALAGVFQACHLVHNLAQTGQCDDPALQTTLESILKLDANSVETVFGDCNQVKLGLQRLQKQLSINSKPDIEITQYAVSLLYLQKKLQKNSKMMEFIRSEIKQVESQLKHFDILHPNIIAKLADIYQQSISQLGPKIMIKGEQKFLANTDNANKIRALLLAGIRAGVLFRQCKGSKFKLLLKRKKYLEVVDNLLNQ